MPQLILIIEKAVINFK